ncbi:MAG: MG2 domain-containing protein [Nitrososphaera sp.]|jgi:hypothetical protein
MKFDGLSNSIKIFSVFSLVALVGTSLIVYNAYAQEESVGIKNDVTVKLNPNKSEIDANASASANVTAKSNEGKSDESSQVKSSEDMKSSSEVESHGEAESHGHYAMSYEKMSASSDDTITIQTERHLYKPGDQVTIEGSFWSNLVSTVGGINTVSVQVTDNNGTVVYTGKGQVNAEGDYSASFQLPSDAKNGAYKVDIKADVNSDVLNSLPIKMQAGIDSSTKFVVISPNAWAVKAEGKDFQVNIASNSSVTNLHFDGQNKKLSFTVQGETGTKGVTQVTIPKSMLSGDLTVMIDGQAMAQSDVVETADTSDSTTLELNYHHSTHTIDIVGTNSVPEFPLASIILVAGISSLILVYNIKPKLRF